MIFTQLVFFLFFAVTAGVHWALRTNEARKRWLFLASYFFYGYWDYRFLALIFASTCLDYATGLWLGRFTTPRARKALITLSIVANLGILGFFKYFNFFVHSTTELLGLIGVSVSQPTLNIILPVGVSFFTFQSMSYTIDVYRKVLAPTRKFLDFALYVAFFPQLVAGPIARASHFLPQLASTRELVEIDGRRALLLFFVGYFKKACVADNIASAIDPVFGDPTAYAATARLLASTLYSVQIYCDFSGYTDMAIGVAALLGYQLAKNFDSPYLSLNVREFWQRWHISLSSWLRSYLYIPLGGNRGGPARTARSLMLTMLLGGLWHGANWTFVLWGFLHGAALIVHRFVAGTEPRVAAGERSTLNKALSLCGTFVFVAFCFTIFRCSDIGSAWQLFTAPARVDPEVMAPSALWWLAFVLLAGVHALVYRYRTELVRRARALSDAIFYPALGAAWSLLLLMTPLAAEPFIYFQF
jgi:alginate O-acetyltransferase complex protein AlgI